MASTFTDAEIAELLREPKPLPDDWQSRVQPRPKRGHDERDLELSGEAGSGFRLILRKSCISLLDFSVILAVRVPGSNLLFRLRRYNGKSHEHTNIIEEQSFYGFHIHMATERYQHLGTREDAFAEPTGRYGDPHGALECLIQDANLVIPLEAQGRLFEEGWR